jgi:hypothetical protein
MHERKKKNERKKSQRRRRRKSLNCPWLPRRVDHGVKMVKTPTWV